MRRTLNFGLLGIVLLGLATFGAIRVAETVFGDHDGWDLFQPTSSTNDPLRVDPEDLLSSDERSTIEQIVQETWGYGLSWSIVVQESTEVLEQSAVDSLAEDLYSETPIQSRADAGDGLLMLVVVPESDPTQTRTAFVAGPNLYPKGGITPQRLREIADVQMSPIVADEEIGAAVIEGATWVEWTQLFVPIPDAPPTNLERGLQNLLEPLGALGFAGLALLVGASAVVIVIMTWRGSGTSPSPEQIDGVLAAAVARGRVDRAIVLGSVLDAVDRGVLDVDTERRVHPAASGASERDAIILSHLARAEGEAPTLDTLVESISQDGELKTTLEDRLAALGAMHPKSSIFTVWTRWISIGGLVLGTLAIVVSILGEARISLLTAVLLALMSLVVLIWNERRSWTTRTGRHALTSWRDLHPSNDDSQRRLFEAVTNLETWMATHDRRSPIPPPALRLLPDTI